MKRELEELSGGAVISGSVGDVPTELEEIFWSVFVRSRRHTTTRILIGLFSLASR